MANRDVCVPKIRFCNIADEGHRPGGPCLRCCGLITDKRLEQEAERYGAAGERPQVVWPNGVLASTAVGLLAQLLTPWFPRPPLSGVRRQQGNAGLKIRGSDVMTPGIHCCREDDDLAKAVRHMEELQVRRLPVMDENKRMVGILSLGDISHSAPEDLISECIKSVSGHHHHL